MTSSTHQSPLPISTLYPLYPVPTQDDILVVRVEDEHGRLWYLVHAVRVPDDVVLPRPVHQLLILHGEDGVSRVVLVPNEGKRSAVRN